MCQARCLVVSFANDGKELGWYIAVAALPVPVFRVEEDGVACVEDYLAVIEGEDDGTLEDVVELLAPMVDELCGLVMGVKGDEEGLEVLLRKTPGKILEVIARKSVDLAAFACLDEVEGVEMSGLARQDLRELDAKAICHVIDGRDGHVGTRLLPLDVSFQINVKVGGHVLGRYVAGLADASDALANGDEIS